LKLPGITVAGRGRHRALWWARATVAIPALEPRECAWLFAWWARIEAVPLLFAEPAPGRLRGGTMFDLFDPSTAASPAAPRDRTQPAPATLWVFASWCGRTVWLRFWGELNRQTADRFQHHVELALEAPCRRLILDLTRVAYMGGDVLNRLLAMHERLCQDGIELRLVAPAGSRCARTLEMAQLDRRIPTFARALDAWRHRHGRR
jgi:anti-anti-sigma factor